ncbi:hypothetical protein [Demequina sp. NBRC 110054]|uniref:hypothetical protein n=1 Tax=Demequina sp. NBRC 110054 TaxID=1570343 RepID=UPI000A05BD22|nr:hypothetical protein [Demequina sp. NBRC 110054]
MTTARALATAEPSRHSHTFANGMTVPFGVVPVSTPHPLTPVRHVDRRDWVIASCPLGKEHIRGKDGRWLFHVHWLDCIHWQPAKWQECEDGSLLLSCAECRRQGCITLAELDLAEPAKEQAVRAEWLANHPAWSL